MNFNEELARNSMIEVGQDLQFKASVRSGDGWKYAKLKDLTIQKISKNSKSRNDEEDGSNKKRRGSSRPKESSSPTPDSAYLVLEDGCRNPIYTAIAPKHPGVDPHNPLVVSFSFRAFMFQDMLDGDTLRISAKIMACQEQVDCQPVSYATCFRINIFLRIYRNNLNLSSNPVLIFRAFVWMMIKLAMEGGKEVSQKRIKLHHLDLMNLPEFMTGHEISNSTS